MRAAISRPAASLILMALSLSACDRAEAARASAPSARAASARPPSGVDDPTKAIAEVNAMESLLATIADVDRPDEEAQAALSKGRGAGLSVRELASAAVGRGQALLRRGARARAKTFFEWAREKDAKNYTSSFSLAKLAAADQDEERTGMYLQEVKDRGGKRLLLTVGGDPDLAAMRDRPAIRAIWQ